MLADLGEPVDAPPVVARRGAGRGSGVTPTEAFDIRLLAVEDGLNISQIAAKTGRTRETIGKVLKDPETDALRKDVNAARRKGALDRLSGSVATAADRWVESMDVAAKKGDHRPMRDLLLSEKVIEPIGDSHGGGLVVQIGGGSNVKIGLLVAPSDRVDEVS